MFLEDFKLLKLLMVKKKMKSCSKIKYLMLKNQLKLFKMALNHIKNYLKIQNLNKKEMSLKLLNEHIYTIIVILINH